MNLTSNKGMKTCASNVTIRIKNLNSEFSTAYKDNIVENPMPVVFSGGLFSDLFRWEQGSLLTLSNGLARQMVEEGRDSWEIEVTGGPLIERPTLKATLCLILAIILLFILLIPPVNAPVEGLINSFNFYFSTSNTLVVTDQHDYMLDHNNNSVPDMLYFNLTTNVTTNGVYRFLVDLEDANSITTLRKNESVTTSTTRVILNISTEFLTNSQFNYSVRVYNESGFLAFRKFGQTTMNYPSYEGGLNITAITDANVDNNFIRINLTINATRAMTENVTVFMVFNTSALESTKETIFIIGQNNVTIDFDNESIKRTHYNSAYVVDRVAIGKKSIDVNHTTASYSFETFAKTSFFKSYADAKIDTDVDGLIDYLQINYTIDNKNAGVYTVDAQLFDTFDNFVVSMVKSQTLSLGVIIVELLIAGTDVYKSRIDGPYRIKFANLNDSIGTPVDVVVEPYMLQTPNLTFSSFERPSLPNLIVNMTTSFDNNTLITTANVTINNSGTADALNVFLDVFDNRNLSITESVQSLAIGQLGIFNYSIFNASNRITAIADFDNIVDELNESDNIVSIGNDPPTTPANMTCGEATTKLCTEPRTYSQFIRINASGSMDSEKDNITYVIEAYYNHSTIGLGPNITISAFTNGFPSETLWFFDRRDIIRDITIPKAAVVSGANFSIQGVSGGRWNYTGGAFSVASFATNPAGIAYDPDKSLWVTHGNDKVSNWNPDSGTLIRSCAVPNVLNIRGIYADSSIYNWVIERNHKRAYRIRESNCQRVSNFTLHTNNANPSGLTSDGTNFFVTDTLYSVSGLRTVFKYNSNGAFVQVYTLPNFPSAQPWYIEYENANSRFYVCPNPVCVRYTSSFSFFDQDISKNSEGNGVAENGTTIWRAHGGGMIYPYYELDSYPDNIFVDVGNDGDNEFGFSGEFSSSALVSFVSELNSLLKTCKPIAGNCTIQVRFHTDTYGGLSYSNVNIVYNKEEEIFNYFYDVVGNHSETSPFVWNLSNVLNQSGVQLQARATDLTGSKLYSSYFAPSMSITINSSFVPNQIPYPQSVVITPRYPHDNDTLDCAFNVTDADDPFINVNVTWIKNMVPYTEDTENFTNVASGSVVHTTVMGDIEPEDTTLYDEWVCKIAAYDEEDTTVDVSSSKVIIPPLIANFSMLANSGLNAIFEFTMLNPGKLNDEYAWTLAPGDGLLVNSTMNMTLVPTEKGFVYVEHNYGTGGSYNVTVTVTNFAITDDETITVEVTQPGD